MLGFLLIWTTITEASSKRGVDDGNPEVPGQNITPRYAVIDLGLNFSPLAINNSGTVVGNALDPSTGYYLPQIWTNGAPITLQPGPYGPGEAEAINDSGVVSGNAKFDYTTGTTPPFVIQEYTACLWTNSTAAPTNIDLAPTVFHDFDASSDRDYASYGFAISSSGTAYGAFNVHAQSQAVAFSAGSAPVQTNPNWDSDDATNPPGQFPTPGGDDRRRGRHQLLRRLF